VKVQLGIFQEQEQINRYFESKGIEPDDIVVAGPFLTRLQAVEWMDFIEEKTGQGKLKRHSVGLMNQQPWYGITFEQKATVTARKPMHANTAQTAAAMH